MKTIKKPAPRVEDAMKLLRLTWAPVTVGAVAKGLGVEFSHAKSLLQNMAMCGRAEYIVVRGVRFYGPPNPRRK